MKTTSRIFRSFAVLGMMFSSLACSVDATETGSGAGETGTTTFAISDAAGTSSATVTIHSDDPADLGLTADDFELVALTADQLGAEAESVAPTQADAGAPASEEDVGGDASAGTRIDLSDEVLGEGVVAVELVERAAPDYRAPFRDRYYYSLVQYVKRASVTRHAVFNRVYISIDYSLVQNGTWYSMLSDYKLANKETKSRDALAGTYQMRLKVRARNTNDYSPEFIQ